MIRTLLQISVGFLVGPGGRMLVVLGAVTASWAFWAWAPLRPVAAWTISEYDAASTEFSRDGATVVTIASSVRRSPEGAMQQPVLTGPLRIWDFPAGRERVTIRVTGSPLRFARLAPDCSWLLTVNDDWTFTLWDPITGLRRADMTPPNTPGSSSRWFAVSEDGRRIAINEPSLNSVRVCHTSTGGLVAEIAAARTPFALSRDGRHLLATMTGADGGPSTVAGFWDLASGRLLFTMPGHREPVGGVAMSPDGRLLATGLRPFPPPAGALPPAEVMIWNAASGQLLATIEAGPPPTYVYNLNFSPDSRLLILRGTGRGLVWDVTESPPRNRDDLIAETEDSGKNGRYLSSQSGPCYAADGPQWFVIGTGRRYLSVAARPEAALRPLQLPRLFGVDSSVSDNHPSPKFGPGGRTLAVTVTVDVPHYQSGPRGVLDRILRRPDRPERWSTVRLYDSATGRKLGTLPEVAWHFITLRGFADEGQTIWTERADRGENYVEAGDTRVFEQWPVSQPETPLWLLAVTTFGVVLIAADGWRLRRRRAARRSWEPPMTAST